jgi:hypothetical protein
VNGPAGGTASAREPALRPSTVSAARPRHGRIAKLLAHEPFVVIVLAVDAVILTLRPSIHVRSDTWLAVVAGRLVWNQGLPHHDTLTVWAQGRDWVDQQWLGQLAFYGLHTVGGLRLLLLVHIALLVAGFAAALAFARRTGGSPRSVAIVGFLSLFVALPNSAARTQTFAYVLFVGVFWLLAASREVSFQRALLTLPLLVLWANVHGSAVLGAGLVVLWALTVVARLGTRRDPRAWRKRAKAAAIAVAAPLCLLLSPYGLGLVGYYHSILGSNEFRTLVTEWQAPTLSKQVPFYVLGLLALWLTARKPRSLTLFEHLALIGTLVAGFEAVRNIVWFALVAVMVVPRALDAVWPVAEAPIRRRANTALSLAAIAACVLAVGAAALHSAPSYAHEYPAAAASKVAAVAAADPKAEVFANEAFADWLLWKVPSLAGRVAFDARFELLTAPQLRAIARFREQSSQDWRAPATGYRVLVLDPSTERPAIRDLLADSGTRRLYQDSHVAVLLRPRSQ